MLTVSVQRRQYLPAGERAVLFCDNTCGPMRRSLFTWFFDDELVELQNSSSSRYSHTRSTQPCIFPGSLNRVPALVRKRRECHLAWQVIIPCVWSHSEWVLVAVWVATLRSVIPLLLYFTSSTITTSVSTTVFQLNLSSLVPRRFLPPFVPGELSIMSDRHGLQTRCPSSVANIYNTPLCVCVQYMCILLKPLIIIELPNISLNSRKWYA